MRFGSLNPFSSRDKYSTCISSRVLLPSNNKDSICRILPSYDCPLSREDCTLPCLSNTRSLRTSNYWTCGIIRRIITSSDNCSILSVSLNLIVMSSDNCCSSHPTIWGTKDQSMKIHSSIEIKWVRTFLILKFNMIIICSAKRHSCQILNSTLNSSDLHIFIIWTSSILEQERKCHTTHHHTSSHQKCERAHPFYRSWYKICFCFLTHRLGKKD